ncbi:2619_t:CDS:2 [Ambispora leptoticha]|uniref:2619_t:CDS:1 n=1 Tax=Ambispora leptoticha TaxID=144679 RepID=A0A9N9BMB4_9GLOM|nr:2619_t:CDS:2 [Ambispora leptoticha]
MTPDIKTVQGITSSLVSSDSSIPGSLGPTHTVIDCQNLRIDRDTISKKLEARLAVVEQSSVAVDGQPQNDSRSEDANTSKEAIPEVVSAVIVPDSQVVRLEHYKPDSVKFFIATEAEKKRWSMGCFRDRERLIGEELLRRSILKSGLSTVWLDDLMKEWKEIHAQFVQIFSQT